MKQQHLNGSTNESYSYVDDDCVRIMSFVKRNYLVLWRNPSILFKFDTFSLFRFIRKLINFYLGIEYLSSD